MNTSYKIFSWEIVAALKAQGYISVQMTLSDEKRNPQAIVEVIPCKSQGNIIDHISLDSKEINDYIDHQSQMAQYVVDIKYLKDPASA